MSYPGAPSYQIDVAEYGYAITPNDTYNTTNFPVPWKMIYCGGAGNIRYLDMGNNIVTLTGCLVGTQYWICGKQVFATGTTATNLVALI